VSIEDVIRDTVDIHKFRNKDEAAKKAGDKEVEDANIKNMRPSSPRSLMACLRSGIDPEEVVYRCAARPPCPSHGGSGRGSTTHAQLSHYKSIALRLSTAYLDGGFRVRRRHLCRGERGGGREREREREADASEEHVGGCCRPLASYEAEHPELQQIQYDKYEKFRRELLEKLKVMRQEVIAEESGGGKAGKPGGGGAIKNGGKMKSTEEEDATMIEREQKRLEAQARRNKREMALIMANETKLMRLREIEEKKQGLRKEKEDAQEKLRLENEIEFKRKQKERDIGRQMTEADEVEQIRLAGIEQFKKAQALAAAQHEAHVRELEEQKLEEERRQAKAAHQRAELERILGEEQEVLMARQKVMEEREVVRQKMMAVRKAEKIVANREKREASVVKVSKALQTAEKMLEARKSEVQSKFDANAARLAEQARSYVVEEQKRKQFLVLKAAERQKKFDEAKKIEADRIADIVDRSARAEVQLKSFQERFQWENKKHKTEHKITLNERRLKVEEMRRATAYSRVAMRQKIEADTLRARKVVMAKESIQDQRRQANINMSMSVRAPPIHHRERGGVYSRWAPSPPT
jgi:hypothetical protein